MKVVISTARPFHASLTANAFFKQQGDVTICSSAPRKFFKGLNPAVRIKLIPDPLKTAVHLFKWSVPTRLYNVNGLMYDLSVSLLLPRCDLFYGWASSSLFGGRAARKRGAVYILDRACPHVDFQQNLIREESEKVGVPFVSQRPWFRQRQLDEYEEADLIVVPSNYSRRTFPEHLQSKIVLAPLSGRCRFPETINTERNSVFTVGVIGGQPLRKGYYYLLNAWKKLALPNSKLLIRSSSDFSKYPVLDKLIKEQPNVEVLKYVPNINDFFRRCDAFILPSVDDGFGMALFEAMANGVASIATRNCGSSEMLVPERDGIVIDPFDADQIAASILRLYEDEDLRQTLALNGRARIAEIFKDGDSELYDNAIRRVVEIVQRPAINAAQSI